MRKRLISTMFIGLAVTAASAAAEDARWSYPPQTTMSPLGVNLQTGRFSYSKTDLSIGSMAFTRSWGEANAMVFGQSRSIGGLSVYSADPIIGWVRPNLGWSHNFNSGVTWIGGTNPSIYVVVDGKQYRFIEINGSQVIPCDQQSQGTILIWNNGQWVFTDRGGNTYTFYAYTGIAQGDPRHSNQALQSSDYADGTRRDYFYNSSVQPIFVRDNRGFAIGIDYDFSSNVSAVCGFNLAVISANASTSCNSVTAKVSYGYNGSGSLTSVTNQLNQIVTMTYTSPSSGIFLLKCISKTNSSACEVDNSYGQVPGGLFYPDQINSQTDAAGNVWSYSFYPPPDPSDVPIVQGQPRYSRGGYTDPGGEPHNFRYDRGHLIKETGWIKETQFRYAYNNYSLYYYVGQLPTQIAYHSAMPRHIVQPTGKQEYIEPDNRGNIVVHSYWPVGSINPIEQTDPALKACCVLLGRPTFPTGSVTYERTFLADYGGVTTYWFTYVLGCGSGPSDAKRCDKPLTVKDANGNVTSYTYDAAHGGVLTETGPSVGGISPVKRYSYEQRYAWIKDSGTGYVAAATPIWVLTNEKTCRTSSTVNDTCDAGSADEVVTTYDYGPNSGPNNLFLRGKAVTANGITLRTCYTYDASGNRVGETSPRAGSTSCS